MEIDIGRQLGAVARKVGDREHDGKPARVVVVEQTYSTTAEDLWEAITTADRLPRWLLPITGELRLGGRYQLQGNAGGEILICQPPRHLYVTWEYGGDISWVDAKIAVVARNSVRLTVEHIARPNEHWKQFGPGAVGIGWDLMILGLSKHLETGSAKVAEEGMKWMMSDDGKSFVRQSSDRWRLADIAGGADPETAKAAADRTTVAYTGATD
jgi:uncharacterized protein YndB with AHSA1/START domain